MTRFKRFSSGQRVDELEPLEFELAGEVFHCKPALQGYELIMFMSESNVEDRGAESVLKLFDRVMAASEYERFQALLTGDDVIISINDLGEIAAWLVEQYTERPTQPQSH